MEVREYSNGEITIRWKPAVCVHAGICVKALPQVYHPKEKPWITMENAASEALLHQVMKCPSGALSIKSVLPIRQEDNGRRGAFIANADTEQVGIMTYTWVGEEQLTIDHIEVREEYRHGRLGNDLVMAAVYFAREQGKKILPLCSFAKNIFSQTGEVQDVLA